MKTKELKKINISISGDESNRSEILYNNVIQNMSLSEDEQIEYLKSKVMNLELELKNKTLTFLLVIISLIGLGFGITLLVKDIYLLGILFILATFVGVILRFYLMHKNIINQHKNNEYEKIEQLRKLLNEKLK